MTKYPDITEEIQADSHTAESGSNGGTAGTSSAQIIANLEDQLNIQKLILQISAKFVNLPAGKVDSEIENGLKTILEFMGIDRCTFAEFSKNRKDLYVTHSCYNPGFEPVINGNITDYFPWLGQNLMNGKIVSITKPVDFPQIASKEIIYCQQSGMKSILAIPVSVGGSLMCTIGFLTFKNYHLWPEFAIEQLTLLGELFANAIFRKRADEESRKHLENLAKQVEFEKLVSGLSSQFVNLQTGQVGLQIEESLRQLTEYLDVDRSTFFRISKERNKLNPIYTYVVEGVETVGDIPFKSWFPWAAARILHGEVVDFSSNDELSPSADHDRTQMKEKLGLKSLLGVPIYIDGKVEYALSVASVKHPHKLNKKIAPRLQLIGEIFINALLRGRHIELMQRKDKQLKAANIRITRISKQLAQENRYYKSELKGCIHSNQIIGISGSLKYVYYRVKQVAPNDTTVLIEGETGSGKELIARALHANSERKEQPLIKIDCATLHDNMIESELFGHEKGAFTGASDRHMGRIELADNATLFLDEIGEVSLALQAKLLRVIEDGEFERVGSSRTIKVNIRIITATNRNLQNEVKNGKFRQDLYYRLNVFPISLPPLRERIEDIPLLADWFIQHFNKQMGKKVSKIPRSVMKELQAYSWPGNVRELKNVIERAMITTEDSVLTLMDILTDQNPVAVSPTSGESMREVEQNHILNVLKETHWRIEGKTGAALKLGLHPDTLRSRMKKHGIRRPSVNK